MRWNCYQRLLLGLGLLLAVLAGGIRPAFPRALEEGEGLVMAFYYASYGLSSWSQDLCDFPEDLYDSSISAVVDRHIHQAQDAGLNAFIQAWQGPSISQNPSETNLRILLERADALNFEVAVLADVTSELLATSGLVKEALIVLRDDLALQSAYLRVDGRPVVFFRGHDRLALSAWQSLRSEVDPAHTMIWVADGDSTSVLTTFDGLYLYDVQQTLQMSSLLKNQGEEVRWWNFTNDESAYWAATVIPGYDDAYLVEDKDDQLERDRNGGRYYRQNFEAATASDPDWIVIRSFNEWTHCTQIEPSGTYASTYLDFTADLIETYRQSLVPDTATPTLEATEAAPSATPTDTPEPTIEATTQPVTATTTITPTATLTPTRTPTLTPSATPFRLATPTPTRTMVPGETRRPEPTGTWRPGATAAPLVTRAPGVVVPTFTPVPRLPVEGYPSNRCSLLPLLLPAMALLLQRRSRLRK